MRAPHTAIAVAFALCFAAACVGEADALPGGGPPPGGIRGNFLYESCEAELEEPQFGFCFGYILGAEEMLQVISTKSFSPTYCRPDEVTNGQIHDLVVGYVRGHPEQHHELALFLVLKALTTTFPCD